MRVLHVSTGLNLGGAETMLLRLLEARDAGDQHHVVSLTDVGPVGRRIVAQGVEVRALGMRRAPDLRKLLALRGIVAELRPDVVQTWMYHADLLGGMAARLARTRVVWGLHNSTLDPAATHRTTRLVVAALARLSWVIPDAIVTVSRTAQAVHVQKGYDVRKFVLIPNGFDLNRFRPDPAVRSAVRAELGVEEGQVLIGMVARVSAQKDHRNFILAAAALARRRPEARFLFCGGSDARDGLGAVPGNPALAEPIREAGLLDRFLLVGPRDDVPRLLNALDLATLSSSFGEAFPLVLGEAMACGVPCVATDVGDSAFLVGDTGRVAPPRDPEALAAAWESVLALGRTGRERLGRAARDRIESRFALPQVAARYAALWRQVVGGSRAEIAGRGAREPS
jgi:glycosyltransferase involved in cell wall biosynthesis